MNIPKSLVRSLYDLQGQRVQTGNRIIAEIKVRMGQLPGKKEEDIDNALAQNFLKMARTEYKRIADAVVLTKAAKFFTADLSEYQIITDQAMLLFLKVYEDMITQEEEMVKVIAKIVASHPLWDQFLKDVKGVGPLMAAVILAEFDPSKARHVSSFWKYCGLDVAQDGQGRSRRKEYLVEREYTNKDGKTDTRNGITFNPFLKTKMVGVLGSSFLKQQADKCPYRKIYDDYKHRLENNVVHADKTKGHRHNMAIRYMVKMFLQDLWLVWRGIEGLPVTPSYQQAKLGHNHGEAA